MTSSIIQHMLFPPCSSHTSATETELADQHRRFASLLTTSAFQPVSDMIESEAVSSGDPQLDVALGGGYRRGVITEFFGEAGSGKTQLLMQAAVASAAAHQTVLFLVSEPLPHNRLSQLAAIAGSSSGVHPDVILAHILISRVPSEDHLAAMLRLDGPAAMQCSQSNVSLVMVDSVAACCHASTHALKAAEMVGAVLRSFAETLQVAVVVTNQVRSRIEGGSAGSAIIAALGLPWSQAVSTRVCLSRSRRMIAASTDPQDASPRLCQSVYAPHVPPFCLRYTIDTSGVHFAAYLSHH